MKTIEVEQCSAEWFAAKCGIPSASEFDKIVTIAGQPSKQRDKYLNQLAAEKITKVSEESYQNEAMKRGCQLEDEARKMYQLMKGVTVKKAGFFLSENPKYGASPDGLVSKEGLVEIKCPTASTHVSYLLEGKLPTEYFQQVQGQLLVTGRKWVDFISYYPAMKPLIVRVKRDEKFLVALKSELKRFCSDLEKIVRKIK